MSISKHLETIMQGHPGHNAQREKAEKSIGKYVMHEKMHVPESFSSKGHEKTRLYAKGGRVHKLNKEQTDMKIPKREHCKKVKTELFSKHELKKKGGHTKKMEFGGKAMKHAMEPFKKGGHAKKCGETYEGHEHEVHGDKSFGKEALKHAYKKGGHAKHHKHMLVGGSTLNETPDKIGINPKIKFKKGGHHKHKYDEGGQILGGANSLAGSPANPMTAKVATPEQIALANQAQRATGTTSAIMKRGGHMKHKHHHHKMASGGSTVWEKQMVGEHPSHHQHHYNYESEMVGERPISKPSTHSNIKSGKKDDENHHQMFAMGGVGKMRHKQSDKSGHQKMGRHPHGH